MNMKKRIISLFMCFVMAFSLLPTAAWAELLPVLCDGQQEVVADPSGDEAQPGDAGENVGGEDADGGAGESDEAGQPEDGAPVEDGENGESGGDNGDADAPAGEDAVPVAPQSSEDGESNEVVSSVTAENAVAQIGEVYYATLPEALAAAKDGDKVTMLADHVTDMEALHALGEDFSYEAYTAIVPAVTKQLTLDLNHKTIDYLEVGYSENDPVTKTTEVTEEGNLTVVSEATYGRIVALEFMGGTLNILGGEFGKIVNTGGQDYSEGGITCKDNSGTVTINKGIVHGLTVGSNASVKVISGFDGYNGQWSVHSGGTLSITGGTFKDVRFVNSGTIAISGGHFEKIRNSGKPLMSLLAPQRAFVNEYTSAVQNGTATSMTDVKVTEHTHTIVDGKCACGMTFVASVTAKDSTVSGYHDTLEKAFQKADWDSTVTLLTNVELSAPLSIEADKSNGWRNNLTLDLNGKTISCAGTNNAAVYNSITLTICDSSTEKNGEIKQNNNLYAVQSGQGGTLTITGGTFGQVGIFGNGVISGGKFSKICAFDFIGTNPEKLYTVLKNGYAFANSDSIIVNGYEKTNAENVTVVEHGTHSFSDGKCACGYTCDHSAGMYSTIGECYSCRKFIAQASVTAGEGTTYYREFTNAINAAMESTANPTLTLWQNVTLPDGDNIYIGDMYKEYNFTIDWNGHTLSGNTASNMLVFSQHTNVTLKDSSDSNAGGVRNTYGLSGPAGGIAVCVSVLNGYCVTIEGGTYSAQVKKTRDCVGTIRISGGVFQNPTGAAVNYALYDEKGGNLAGILAEDCTFSYDANGTDLVNVYGDDHTDAGKTVYVVAHSHSYSAETGKCACGKPCAHDLDDKSVCKNCGGTFVAQVGSDYYTTVTAALSTAGNNGTVTLLKDVTESVTFDAEGKSVTLVMNGKTLTAPNNDNPALTVTNGTLTVEGDAVISNPTTADPNNQTITYAVSISGGKLVFQGDLTAKGGVFNISGNATRQASAVYATGGELDFQKGLDLEGGLTITGSATLTRKLTQGTFRKEYDVITGLSVVGAKNYRYLDELLEDGYAYVDKDETDIFRCVSSFKSWSGSGVTIVPHTHTWGRPETGDNYECTVCGKSCAHEGGYKTGKCEVCGKPCPHDIADQSPVDHNYYCNKCGKQMFARIQTDTYKWSHFTNLQDALAAAEDGQTVLLLGDINNDNQYAIVEGDEKTVTLDLRGHTVNGGWIQVGIDRNRNNYTSSTLNITGTGSFITSGNLSVGYKATLDLSGWTGGKISCVDLSKSGDDESALTVGENAGTIEKLQIFNWPTDANLINYVKKTKLSGGSYNNISITMTSATGADKAILFSSLLAEGYAFQYVESEEFLDYAAKAEYKNGGGSISNVKVVKCEHTSDTVAGTDGKCACGQVQFEARITSGTSTRYAMLADAVGRLQDGDTLTLLTDVEVTSAVRDSEQHRTGVLIDKSVTIDLNGKTLSSAIQNLYGILHINGGTVTVKNGTVKATGYTSSAIYACGGETTLENVTTEIVSNSNGSVAVYAPVTIKSGDYQGLFVSEDGRAVLEGGTFRTYKNISTGAAVNSIYWKVNATDTVTSRDCMELLAEGYGYVDASGNPVRTFGGFREVVTVKQGAVVNDPVAEIGETGYTTLHSAMKAAKNGDVITLLGNLDLGNGAVLLLSDITTSFTIDLDGHTLSADGSFLVHTYDRNSSRVTLRNGTLDGSRCTAYNGGAIWVANRNANDGLTLENVTAKSGTTISNLYGRDKEMPVPVVKVAGGTAVFNGGSYTGGVLISSGNAVLNSGEFYKGKNEYGIKTDVSGEYLADYLGEDSVFWDSEAKQTINDMSNATEAESAVVAPCVHKWANGICTVCGKVCGHQEPVNGECPRCGQSMVASVDGKFYPDFAAALEAVKAARTCTLKLYTDYAYANTALNSNALGYTTLTIDLNGHEVYGASDNSSKLIQVIDDAELVIKDTSAGKNGSVDNVQVTLGSTTTGGKLTLESGAIDTLQVSPNSAITLKAGAKVRYLTTGGDKWRFPVAVLLSANCGLVDENGNWADLSKASVGSIKGTGYYTVTYKWNVQLSGGGTVETPYGSNTIPSKMTVMHNTTDLSKVRFQWYRTDGLYDVLTDYTCTKPVNTWGDFVYDVTTVGSGSGWDGMSAGTTWKLVCVVYGLDAQGNTLWCVSSSANRYELSITKADAVITEMPTAKDLTYTGGAQALVTAGKTSGGTLKYSLVKEGPYDTQIPTGINAGEYTVWYMVEGDSNYNGVEPKSVTVTIGKADAALDTAPAANSLTYNGSAQALVTAGSTQDGAMMYRLGENGEFGSDIPMATDAGSYTVYYKVAGDSNHKDTAEKSVTVTIGQLSISGAEVTLGEGLTYNGKTQTQTVASVKVGELTVPAGSYTVSKNTGAAAKDYTLTVTGTGNFTGTKSVGFTIAKAALTVPEITVDVTNGYAAAYTVDLRAALDDALAAGCSFGMVSYGTLSVTMDAGYYADGSAKVENGRLTLPILANNTESTGSIGTATVTVTTDNYQDITVTVKLNAVNKIVPVGAPTLSTRTITYGEKLNTIRLSGTMRVDGAAVKGTFAWAEPYFCPTSDTYTATWVFTPEDGKYAVVTGTETITVKEPAEPVYTVGGTVWEYNVVGDRNEQAVQGAVVTIRKGLEIIGGQKVTDEKGMFTLDGVVAGVYNVVVEYQGKTVTTKVELTDRNIDKLKVEIPREDVNSKLEIENPTDLISDVVVGGLDKEAGEKFPGGHGDSVSISMGITEPEHKQGDKVQNAIRGSEELTGKTLDFIDMVLTMVKNGEENYLPETTTVLEIIISYDTTRKDIKVVRHHGDAVEGLEQLESLPGTKADGTFYIDCEKKCIHIFASKFSTYAIGYTPESSNRYYYNGGTAGTKSGESPATGDVGLLPYAAMALTGCTGVVVLTFRRKREHE